MADIQHSTPGALECIDGRTKQQGQDFELSVDEVISGLMAVSAKHKDTVFAMEIAKSMLYRLETLRDELKLRATVCKQHLTAGRGDDVLEMLDSIVRMAAGRDSKHTLAVDAVHCQAYAGRA